MSSHFTDRWPDLAKLKAQLGEARTRLNEEVANVAKGIGREYQEDAHARSALRARLIRKRRPISPATMLPSKMPCWSARAETNRQLYEDVLKRTQEMGVAEQAPLSNDNIVTAAHCPDSRRSQSR